MRKTDERTKRKRQKAPAAGDEQGPHGRQKKKKKGREPCSYASEPRAAAQGRVNHLPKSNADGKRCNACDVTGQTNPPGFTNLQSFRRLHANIHT
jgi:DNA invertase Pin-like site-specific DNA recombinase